MKYIDGFRDGEGARALASSIAREVVEGRKYRFMEFCGGHTHAIFRYGIHDLLPDAVEMVHGPGCPVCVLPIQRIDHALALAKLSEVTLCSYGDMLRVPGSGGTSLQRARAAGSDVRMVYSCLDALKIAEENPGRKVIFFAIGFETTTPPTAVIIKRASEKGIRNFSVFSNHILTPPAIAHILEAPKVRELGTVSIDGFVGPAHVSTVIGSRPYEFFASEFHKPVVIAGFEPLDVLQAILMLIRQTNEGLAQVENEFTRAVTPEGNLKAQALVADVFELRSTFAWRGLGNVPYSGLRIRKGYAEFDAETLFDVEVVSTGDNPACLCGAILRGFKKPTDCPLFGKACTPERPVGSCMVSSEGACAAYFTFGRVR